MPNDLEKSLATVAKGVGVIFAGTVLGNSLGICNQILLARFLGPSEYGILNLAISIVVIVSTFASFGLVGALPAFIPRYNRNHQEDLVKSIIYFSIKFVIFVSAFIGCILYLFSDIVSINLFHQNELSKILQLFAISLPFLVLSNVLQSILRAFGGAKHKVYLYDIAIPLTKITVFALFIIIGHRLFGATIAYIVAFIIISFTSVLIIQRKYISFLSLTYKKLNVYNELLSFSWPFALTGVIFLFISKTDIILLGHYFTSNYIGVYTVSLNVVSMLAFVGDSFEWVFLPVITKHFATGKEELHSLFKSSSKWMFIAVLPIFLFIILFSRDIILLLFGSEYVEAFIPLIILTFGISMNAFTGLTGSMLIGSGHTKLNLVAEIIAGITNVAFNIILIPIYGVTGAAIGTAASHFMRNCASLAFVHIKLHMNPFERAHINIVLSGVSIFILFHFFKLNILSSLPQWIYVSLNGILFFVTYGILILNCRCIGNNDKFILQIITKKLNIGAKWLGKIK